MSVTLEYHFHGTDEGHHLVLAVDANETRVQIHDQLGAVVAAACVTDAVLRELRAVVGSLSTPLVPSPLSLVADDGPEMPSA